MMESIYKFDDFIHMDRQIKLMWNIKDPEKTSLFLINDGDMFDRIENNVLGKIRDNIDNVVICLIYPNDRGSEYTPWKSDDLGIKVKYFPGNGDGYLGYVFRKLVPRIESKINMRIKDGNIFMAGASLGGLISTYAMFKYPKEIGGGIFISSSYWYPNFVDYVKATDLDLEDKLIYIDIGSKESPSKITLNKSIVSITEDMVGLFLDKNLKYENIYFIIQDDMEHRESYFIDRIYDGILFIYNKMKKGD